MRNRVKAQVKKSLEEAERAGGKEANKKNLIQKVSIFCSERAAWRMLTSRRFTMSLLRW